VQRRLAAAESAEAKGQSSLFVGEA
jgi:hypothetical protein